MNQVRIGIIGAGRISHVMSTAHAQVPESKLHGVFDVVRASAEKLASKFNIPNVYDSYQDMLASDEIDAVLVCTPTFLHEQIVIDAANAGKHVFCQKPMALTLEQCERMNAAALENNIILQVGFMIRYTPPFVEVKERLDAGEIGDIIAIRSAVFGWEPSAEWFYDPDQGGGILIDTIIHTFDLYRWYAGEVTSIYADGGAYVFEGARKFGTADNIMCALKFENGAMGSIYGSWSSGYGDKTLEIYGTKGSFFIDLMEAQGGRAFIKKDREAEAPNPAEGWNNLGVLWKFGYQQEARQFTYSVLGKVPPQATGTDAVAAQRLALLADESIRTSKVVHI
ncbi:Gfo/Idh/MocA family oxidoreductase [Paenibacillus rhizovicinus]|uniref:Gfo/Idh/MocA family oxidoreductase n=1 Tax=Paenibacillus rhizovicinus TaxID=2704463 RepID=A0A6C0P2R6_9BACL|nr:Gfo/Idh/MocA family oxidoreductase [Paenibacillus rhizovicinus]QHW32745.1 Gfo/Idh/MocA family oxidoreductase [Paenibacillus rhizovicinus]